jgi:hypothetical protein
MEETIAFQIVGLWTFICIGASVLIALIIKANMASRNLIKGPMEFRFTSLLFGSEKFKKLIAIEQDNKVRRLFKIYIILYKIITTLAVVCLFALILLYSLD